MHELLIRGANVYDGLGNPPKQADVAVDKGRVSVIGKVTSPARETVDATGLSLMPGIVDLHTHYDAQVTWDRTMSPSPALGVTTAVIGNCGFGVAPCPAGMRETMMKNLSVVEGMDLNALLTGVRWEFETFPEYMDQLRRTGPYLNTAVFAGHSVMRTAVMGEAASERVEPSEAELAELCRLLREAHGPGSRQRGLHPHQLPAAVVRLQPHRPVPAAQPQRVRRDQGGAAGPAGGDLCRPGLPREVPRGPAPAQAGRAAPGQLGAHRGERGCPACACQIRGHDGKDYVPLERGPGQVLDEFYS